MIKLKKLINEARNKNIEVRLIHGEEEKQKFDDFITHGHYLGTDAPNIRYRFGAFKLPEEEMFGLISYGNLVAPTAAYQFVDANGTLFVNKDEILELRRLFVTEEGRTAVPNAGSQIISLGNEEMHKLNPKIKLIITYFDPKDKDLGGPGHVGGVYRGANGYELPFEGDKGRFLFITGNPTTRKIMRKYIEDFIAHYKERKQMLKDKRQRTLSTIQVDKIKVENSEGFKKLLDMGMNVISFSNKVLKFTIPVPSWGENNIIEVSIQSGMIKRITPKRYMRKTYLRLEKPIQSTEELNEILLIFAKYVEKEMQKEVSVNEVNDKNDSYVLYGIRKTGIGTYLYDADIDELKKKIDRLGYKGRYSIDDMIPNEDYVIEKNNRAIRLYSNVIQSDRKVSKLLKDAHMTAWAK